MHMFRVRVKWMCVNEQKVNGVWVREIEWMLRIAQSERDQIEKALRAWNDKSE